MDAAAGDSQGAIWMGGAAPVVDTDGNIWSSARDGVHCIAPDGHLIGKILVPEVVSNLCFGGHAKHQLFITATTSIYSVILKRKGVQQP